MLAGVGGLLSSPSVLRAQGQAAGVALVIANSKYKWEAQLPNARRDGADVAKRFQELGLKTALVADADRDAMRRALDGLASASRGANIAIFYFAGHGVTSGPSTLGGAGTYLVPVDADLSDPSQVESLVPVQAVRRALNDALNRLMIFDNCRNNPADGWRQQQSLDSNSFYVKDMTNGAAKNAGWMWMFSASPGRVAIDGPPGQNSPFATSLLRQLAGETADLRELAGGPMRRDLLIATEGRQIVQSTTYFRTPVMLQGLRDPAGTLPANTESSRIIELPNAFAFARENNYPLQKGLIAFRPPDNSPDRHKVGAFKFTERTEQGLVPALMVVMLIDDNMTAEIMTAGKDRNGSFWRQVRGSVAGNRLEYKLPDPVRRLAFDWHDANSGSMAILLENGRPHVSSFSRLDG